MDYDRAIDPLLLEAHEKSIGCNNCYQRDWVYYGIHPASGKNNGPLNRKFKEAITEIKPSSTALFGYMGGWDEGEFVIVLNAMFGSRTQTNREEVPKIIPVNPNELFTFREETRYYGLFNWFSYKVRIVDSVRPLTFSSPVIFDSWDMEEYGEKWTLIAEEYDQLKETTSTFVDTNKYGLNFSATAGSKDKLGASLGASGEFTKQTTISYKTNDGNDALGSAFVRFTDPVITRRKNPETLTWQWEGVEYPIVIPGETQTYELTTGSLLISFEAVRVAQ